MIQVGIDPPIFYQLINLFAKVFVRLLADELGDAT